MVDGNGTLLCLHRWSFKRGTTPSPRQLRLQIKLGGIPLILCNGVSVNWIACGFGTLELGSLQLISTGSLTTIEGIVQVSNLALVPPIMALEMVGEAFIARISILPEGQ